MDSRKHVDIIGIGSLNVDFTATTEKMNALSTTQIKEVMERMAYGAERLVQQNDIEAVITLLGRDSFKAVLGGSAFNTICAIAALHSGIQAGYVGVAGQTSNSGLDFVAVMQQLAIDHKYVDVCTDQSSGLCIAVNHDGIRSFLFYPGGNNKMADYLQANYHEILSYVKETRILHITQFTDDRIAVLLAKLIKDTKRANPLLIISCDPGFCWLKNFTPAVGDIIKAADILFLNAIEFNLLCGVRENQPDREKAALIFEQYGLQDTCLFLKNPSDIKTYCRCRSQIVEQIYPIDVVSDDEIIDATGAGDAFAAGVLTGLLLPEPIMAEAVELGMRFMRAKLLTFPDKLYGELKRLFSAR